MKSLKKIFEVSALVLTIITLVLMLTCTSVAWSGSIFGFTIGTSASGVVGIFGDEGIKASWTAIIAFVLLIVVALALIASIALSLTSKKSVKVSNLIAFVSTIALIIAGILIFCEVSTFRSANSISETAKLSLGSGWAIAGILAICAAALTALSVFVKVKKSTKKK